jgi:hypothetical protein
MPQYTSHIYAQPASGLVSFLYSHPILSSGLFHIRQLAPGDTKDIARNGLPEEGLVVIREVCDPTKPRDSHDEAQTHEDRGAPVISWWDLLGPQDVRIIPPENIPTLAFGNIHNNHQTNLPPPVEFLRFLKHLSMTFKALIAFYHHYTAYEDRLADCEYAWIFGQRDSVYIRHINEPYKVVLYTTDDEPQVVYDRFSDDQPILFSILQEFDVALLPSSYRTYFHDFKWNSYKV